MKTEVGARADLREWRHQAASGNDERAAEAAARVMSWLDRGGVPAKHWDNCERTLLAMLCAAHSATRTRAGLEPRLPGVLRWRAL